MVPDRFRGHVRGVRVAGQPQVRFAGRDRRVRFGWRLDRRDDPFAGRHPGRLVDVRPAPIILAGSVGGDLE